MATFKVKWPTVKGARPVEVEAAIGERGDVQIESVCEWRNHVEAGALVSQSLVKLNLARFEIAERLALFQVLRLAAGICPTCAGAKRVVSVGRRDRPGGGGETIIDCPTCHGSGRGEKK